MPDPHPARLQLRLVFADKHAAYGDTIALLEAMKLFSPLTLKNCNPGGIFYDPEKAYEVVRVIPTPGQAVNKGDLLFVIKEAL